jgi:ribosomal protein S18 acetylase RimI-like enzyme
MIRDFIAGDQEAFLSMAGKFYSSDAVAQSIDPAYFEITFNTAIDKSPFVRGLMIEEGTTPVGYAILSFTYSNEAGGSVVQIEEVFIEDGHRGKGLGRKFFAFLESEYPTAKRFRLEVSPNNVEAQALYQKLGFKILDYVQMVRDS